MNSILVTIKHIYLKVINRFIFIFCLELWTSNSDAKDDESLTYLGYKGRKKHVTYEAEGFYVEPEKIEEFPHGCVSLIRGVKAVKIYPNQKKILLSNGDEVQYDKVLIATGMLINYLLFRK